MSEKIIYKSIPLISIEQSYSEESYSLELTSESIEYLSSLNDKKISIISIIGPTQTEKSKLANSLFNDYTIFNWKKPTKGINIYSKNIENPDLNLLILDTKGLKLSNSLTKIDNNIFITCLLISSTIIYNTYETPENAIQNFSKLAKDSLLKIKNNREENNQISLDNIPNIHFLFQNVSGNVNEQLKKANNLLSTNELFQKTFKKYNISVIPKNSSQIDIYSSNLIEELKKGLISKLLPKKINGINLNGTFIFGLIQTFIDYLNRDELIYLDEQMSDVISLYLTDVVEQINSEINQKEIHEKLLLSENNFYENMKENFSSLIESLLEKFREINIVKEIKSIEIITPFESIVDKVVEIFDEEINNIKNDYLTNLEDNINKEIKISRLNQNTIQENFSNLNSYLTSMVNIILDNQLTGVNQILIKNYVEKINKYIESLSNGINKIIEDLINKNKQLTKINEQKQKEIIDILNSKDQEINNIRLNFENNERYFKEKELELNNLINIEKEKYIKLEESQKEYREKSLSKIEELQKYISKNELSSINNQLIKYESIFDNLENNEDIVLKNIFIEKTLFEMEKKYSNIFDLLSQKDSLDQLNKYYEKQKEKLNNDIKNLKEIINEQKKQIEELKDNLEGLNLKLEEKTNEYDYKCSQYLNNSQTIEFLQNNLNEQKKKLENLYHTNYQNSISIQTYKNEKENLINIIKGLSKKQNKESIKYYIQNLTEKTKKIIESILK